MDIKLRLKILSFLEFFIWGSYLTSLGTYMFVSLKFSGPEIGSIFTTLGISSLFMPALIGIIADKYVNSEKLLAVIHSISALFLIWASTVQDSSMMFWIMLLVAMFYMPTIALVNSISYNLLNRNNLDVIKDFPAIRVWGTIGFIVAMWVVDLLGWIVSKNQFYVGAFSGFLMAIFSFFLPACPPAKSVGQKSWVSILGLDAFVLMKQPKMLIFFVFSMLLGAALQITNMLGQDFLGDFGKIDQYKDAFAVQHTGILMSISQISETVFILVIPFFLIRYGIKKVMLLSMIAWVLRFGLFAFGNPGNGLILLILSMVIYGFAFDFFNISGSLFVEKETDDKIRSSAQGLFMMMTNGFGSIIGALACGYIVEINTVDGTKDWYSIWMTFAAYALILAVTFPFVFKYKHDPASMGKIAH
ncbi:MAG TPA: nucleoside permease [Saprospiraceae bacterium]|jgi:NHS family xanthosine MFS transporter|nr:nucleoside permease [Saprospiraceae bacterium]MBK7697805.1 nucleoside permease [Saprospiraceae bacterium]MBK8885506.1 nucleoside permease [Saprospiraceae bacterium]MBK9581019.1 nucleoside permease [Saprospiraceae bacterium]MBP6539629.1 nucleoside permease [Saprospiraceae bacterium]